MSDELIDIYDENNNSLGIKKMKSEAHKKGLWHRASHVWIYNDNRKLLIQLRAKEEKIYPNRWCPAAAGHVGSGEDEADAAIREMNEEIGLSIKKEEDLEFFKINKIKHVYKEIRNNEVLYLYLLKFDGNIKELVLKDDEVAGLKFVDIDILEKDVYLNSDKYIPLGTSWSDVIKEIKSRLSV